MHQWNIRVISDSLGETGEQVVHAMMKQFPSIRYHVVRYPGVISEEQIDNILLFLEEGEIVISTIVLEELRNYLLEQASTQNIHVFDILGGPLMQFEGVFGIKAVMKPGANRELDTDYFSKIAAIEFTVKYDDGKDPRGIPMADVTLVGVSRTSKTPTSMYLANKGYKVVNIPMVPEIEAPKELFTSDPKRIIGLIIDPDKLNAIREERLRSLGIEGGSTYAQDERIRKELVYAKGIMKKIGCEVLDVSNSTIEGTAGEIVKILNRNFPGNPKNDYIEF
ncbi:MAG: pyruvate, water dikinase regulatory protein [Tissierellia bacterium]|nr:pyruvate, water dikinase regulatory protein [Tissierellia bacterium]